MKNFLQFPFILVVTFSLSCKKAIESKQRDLLVDAITNGYWEVQQYMEGTVDITSNFSGYSFQFEEKGTVHGIYGSSTTHGTWEGDLNNRSITSNFPGATDPLKKFNGTWRITDSSWDFVEAEMNTANGKNILYLRKKP